MMIIMCYINSRFTYLLYLLQSLNYATRHIFKGGLPPPLRASATSKIENKTEINGKHEHPICAFFIDFSIPSATGSPRLKFCLRVCITGLLVFRLVVLLYFALCLNLLRFRSYSVVIAPSLPGSPSLTDGETLVRILKSLKITQ